LKGNHQTLAEVPFRLSSRQNGDSKFNAGVIIDYSLFVVRLRLGRF